MLAPLLFQEELYALPARVAVVLVRPWEQYEQAEKDLLEKILASVRLDLSSVQILNQENFAPDTFSGERVLAVLVFGSKSEGLQPYQVLRAQGFSMLMADDLSALDEARKKSLWLALRDMFSA